MEKTIEKCMFCHTTASFGTTSIYYQDQKLRYCQECEHKIMLQELAKQQA